MPDTRKGSLDLVRPSTLSPYFEVTTSTFKTPRTGEEKYISGDEVKECSKVHHEGKEKRGLRTQRIGEEVWVSGDDAEKCSKVPGKDGERWDEDLSTASCMLNALLRVSDVALGLIVFAPALVCFWSGTWNLLDLYCLPGQMYWGSWLSFLAALFCRLIMVALEPVLTHIDHSIQSKWVKIPYRLSFTLFSGIVMLGQWRGLWNILDEHLGEDPLPNWIGVGISTGYLVATRSLITATSAPMYLALDNNDNFFVCNPRFQTKRTSSWWRFWADHLFSLVTCDSACIGLWQGIWNLWVYAIKNRAIEGALPPYWFCAATGAFILITLALLQLPISRLSHYMERRHLLLKLLVEDIYYFLGVGGILAYWLGLWETLEDVFLPDQPLLYSLITLFSGYFVMAVLGCSALLISPGVFIDGAMEGGEGIIWDISYLHRIIERRDRAKAASATVGKTHTIAAVNDEVIHM